MKVNQIYEIINGITGELLGKTDLVQEDLSNIVDVGVELFDSASVDNYVKALVNKVGKTIFVNRAYSGNIPSVLMDSWEFGSVLEKIQADIPQATENDSWNLTDGETYNQDIFYKPSVSAKFFNKKVTFEVPMSFTELQVKESFTLIVRNVEHLLKNGAMGIITQITWGQPLGGIFGNNYVGEINDYYRL